MVRLRNGAHVAVKIIPRVGPFCLFGTLDGHPHLWTGGGEWRDPKRHRGKTAMDIVGMEEALQEILER